MQSNADWNTCIDSNSIKMGRCVHSCDGDVSCENDCLAEFKSLQIRCPCEVRLCNIMHFILISSRKTLINFVE